MIDRKAAVALIQHQMSDKYVKKHHKPGGPEPKFGAWHYGYVELRQLLDAIYGPPKGECEKLPKPRPW